MKYARCKIKNIGIFISKYWQEKDHIVSYPIEEVNSIPNNCIRIISNAGWCHDVCTECEDDL